MRLIPGPSLIGFFGLFESDYGDSNTPKPYVTITPSCVGTVPLPFCCPNCQKVVQEFSSEKTREHYHDKRAGRDNYWCPHCGYRFVLDLRGMPLPSALPAGAASAPARVTKGEKVTYTDSTGSASYEALAEVAS